MFYQQLPVIKLYELEQFALLRPLFQRVRRVCQRHLLQSSAFFPERTYYASKSFAHGKLSFGNVDVFEM